MTKRVNPDGAVGTNLLANGGDTGSIPGMGRFHILQSDQALEPQLLKPKSLEPMFHNKRSHCTTTKSSPCSSQLEKACV